MTPTSPSLRSLVTPTSAAPAARSSRPPLAAGAQRRGGHRPAVGCHRGALAGGDGETGGGTGTVVGFGWKGPWRFGGTVNSYPDTPSDIQLYILYTFTNQTREIRKPGFAPQTRGFGSWHPERGWTSETSDYQSTPKTKTFQRDTRGFNPRYFFTGKSRVHHGFVTGLANVSRVSRLKRTENTYIR